MTDLIKDNAFEFIEAQIEAKKPFFAYIAPHAPYVQHIFHTIHSWPRHTRATPAPGSDGYFWDWESPRLPSWVSFHLPSDADANLRQNHASPDKHWMIRTQVLQWCYWDRY